MTSYRSGTPTSRQSISPKSTHQRSRTPTKLPTFDSLSKQPTASTNKPGCKIHLTITNDAASRSPMARSPLKSHYHSQSSSYYIDPSKGVRQPLPEQKNNQILKMNLLGLFAQKYQQVTLL